MTNIFYDNFDEYTRTVGEDIVSLYMTKGGWLEGDGGAGTIGWQTSPTPPSHVSGSLLLARSQSIRQAFATVLSPDRERLFVGSRVHKTGWSAISPVMALGYRDGISNWDYVQLYRNSSDGINVYRYDDVGVDASEVLTDRVLMWQSADGVWPDGEFTMVEMMSDPVWGSLNVRVDGVCLVNLNGLLLVNQNDTALPAVLNTATIYGSNNDITAPNNYFTDFYLNDALGVHNNGFWGPRVRQRSLRPSGPGSHEQFTAQGGGGAHNFSRVNTVPPPDDDSVYVHAQGVGIRDSYVFDDLPDTAVAVRAAMLVAHGRKTISTSRKYRLILSQGGVDAGSSDIEATDNYEREHSTWETAPPGGPITPDTINSAQGGYEVTV